MQHASVSNHPYYIELDGKMIATDQEGYIIDIDEWSEAYANAIAARERLELTDEHWEVIRFIREHYHEHHVQPQVRMMIKHFERLWGPDRGNNRYLHDIFPMGGPQKQGNRLAGIHRTRGEH